jgi:hypothetical protein
MSHHRTGAPDGAPVFRSIWSTGSVAGADVVYETLDLILALAQLFLQAAIEFVLLSLLIAQVVIGQLAIFLLQLPFDLIPIAFEFISFSSHDGLY